MLGKRTFFGFIIFPLLIYSKVFAHDSLKSLPPEDIKKLQELLIEEKFLNPAEVIEMGKYDNSVEIPFDKYTVCINELKNKCDELKYDFNQKLSTSTKLALGSLERRKWWDKNIEVIAGVISLLFGLTALVFDLKEKVNENYQKK